MQNDENINPHYTENSLPERFDSWIKKILDGLIFNEVKSYARKKRRQPEYTTENLDNLASYNPFEEEELVEILVGSSPLLLKNRKLAESLGKISARKQQVIEGTIVLGIPISVLAELLGLDPQIVSNYKLRGLNELRSMMEGSEDE